MSDMIEFNKFFFFPKTLLCFKAISKECNTSTLISKKTNITFTYVILLIKELTKFELINLKEKNGRLREIELTEKGKDIQKLLFKIDEVIS